MGGKLKSEKGKKVKIGERGKWSKHEKKKQ